MRHFFDQSDASENTGQVESQKMFSRVVFSHWFSCISVFFR